MAIQGLGSSEITLNPGAFQKVIEERKMQRVTQNIKERGQGYQEYEPL